MNKKENLDELLSAIEFPGENAQEIGAYLQQRDFTNKVMEKINHSPGSSWNTLLWTVFSLGNLLLILYLGTNAQVARTYLHQDNVLSLFIILFPVITLFGSLAGLVLSVDSLRLLRWFYRPEEKS